MSNRDESLDALSGEVDIDAWGPTGPTEPALREKWLAALAKRYANGTLDEVLIPEQADMTSLVQALRDETTDEPPVTH